MNEFVVNVFYDEEKPNGEEIMYCIFKDFIKSRIIKISSGNLANDEDFNY